MKKSDIFMVVGCVLFISLIFLGILAIYSVRIIYVDSAIIVEIHPFGGMPPGLYIILLWLLFFSSFLSLLLAIYFAPKEASEVSGKGVKKGWLDLSVGEAKKGMLLAISIGVFSIVFGWWFKEFKLPHLLPAREPVHTTLTIMPYLFWGIGSFSIVGGTLRYILVKRRHGSAKS
ncbi:MAG: hypothetical protein ACE5J6_03625 [Candidatus Bathyarchaeia archaeon]